MMRALSAGMVFVVIGIAGTLDYWRMIDAPKPFRSPAGKECRTNACGELVRLKKELFVRPKPGTPADETEERTDRLLAEAGAVLVSIFRDRAAKEVGDDELGEVALFLVETYPQDGAGIALDALELAVGPEKADAALVAIGASVDRLFAENVIPKPAYEAYKAALAANRSEGEPEVARKSN